MYHCDWFTLIEPLTGELDWGCSCLRTCFARPSLPQQGWLNIALVTRQQHGEMLHCFFPKAWRRVLPLGSLDLFS